MGQIRNSSEVAEIQIMKQIHKKGIVNGWIDIFMDIYIYICKWSDRQTEVNII